MPEWITIRPLTWITIRSLLTDGTIRVLRTVTEVLHDNSGRPTKVLGTTQDITQLEEIRDSFVAAQAVVEWLGEHAHVQWYALGAELRVVSVGKQLAGLTNRP